MIKKKLIIGCPKIRIKIVLRKVFFGKIFEGKYAETFWNCLRTLQKIL